MSSKAQHRRVCQFCGQFGSSKAHVIGQALHPVLGDHPSRTTLRYTAEYAGDQYQVREYQPRTDRSRPLLDIVAMAVCRDCNSGWTNEIEAASRNAIRSLVAAASVGSGHRVDLNAEEASAVATWAVLVSWTLEVSNWERGNREPVTTPEMRRDLLTSKVAPANATVAIGQRAIDNVFHSQQAVGYDEGEVEQHALVTLLILRKLVIYVATFDHQENLRPAPPADCWRPIWPNRPR
ncbi:hypothetical protein [Catellatospora paridis]|uniref:hypothetical protein n=1 Tax=Catellatospora paridis TaxID=1617086 RepID=UPI0012D3ED06|nr:hypothetical protein [Catellatospora paridis]